MKSLRPFLAGFVLALVALVGAACGGGASANAPDPSDKLTLPIPASIGGLSIVKDKAGSTRLAKNVGKDTYVKDGTVFALRQGKELKGVLQVVRLTHDATPEKIDFRKKVACAAIGSCRAAKRYLDVLYYEGLVNQQSIYVWFTGHFMETLVVRDEAARTFDLAAVLKQLLTIKPVPAA